MSVGDDVMPKITNTKKQRAEELFKRLKRGPQMVPLICEELPKTEKEMEQFFKENYNIWIETWILPEIKNLIPQLKK